MPNYPNIIIPTEDLPLPPSPHLHVLHPDLPSPPSSHLHVTQQVSPSPPPLRVHVPNRQSNNYDISMQPIPSSSIILEPLPSNTQQTQDLHNTFSSIKPVPPATPQNLPDATQRYHPSDTFPSLGDHSPTDKSSVIPLPSSSLRPPLSDVHEYNIDYDITIVVIRRIEMVKG